MATGLAPATANSLLDALVNQTNYTAPTAVHLKLHLGDPGSAGTSNAAVETTRQNITAAFSAAASGAVTNDVVVTWTNVSTTETISHVSAWSAGSGGTFYWSAALSASKALTAGDTLTLAVGDIDLTFQLAA